MISAAQRPAIIRGVRSGLPLCDPGDRTTSKTPEATCGSSPSRNATRTDPSARVSGFWSRLGDQQARRVHRLFGRTEKGVDPPQLPGEMPQTSGEMLQEVVGQGQVGAHLLEQAAARDLERSGCLPAHDGRGVVRLHQHGHLPDECARLQLDDFIAARPCRPLSGPRYDEVGGIARLTFPDDGVAGLELHPLGPAGNLDELIWAKALEQGYAPQQRLDERPNGHTLLSPRPPLKEFSS